MLFCRNKFEGTLEALSQFETREAQVLMTEALEAMDMMNNAIILQNEVPAGLSLIECMMHPDMVWHRPTLDAPVAVCMPPTPGCFWVQRLAP